LKEHPQRNVTDSYTKVVKKSNVSTASSWRISGMLERTRFQ